MIIPKTLAADYWEFDKERKALGRRASIEKMSSEQFQAGLKAIDKKYEGRVFPEDTFLFDDFNGFEEFGMNRGLDFYRSMRRSIEHEKAHGQKAEELGYTVTYGYSFFISPPSQIFCKTFTRFKEMPMPPEHIKQIAEAPKNLSISDKSLVNFMNEI